MLMAEISTLCTGGQCKLELKVKYLLFVLVPNIFLKKYLLFVLVPNINS